MTPDKEKPCNMPKEIWLDNITATTAGTKEFHDSTRYVRADQPPPLPDDVREAVEVLHPLVDAWEFSSEITFAIKTLIRAATQQPEVVTVEDMTMLIQDWKFNEENQQPFFGSYLAKRFPNGIKIVEG